MKIFLMIKKKSNRRKKISFQGSESEKERERERIERKFSAIPSARIKNILPLKEGRRGRKRNLSKFELDFHLLKSFFVPRCNKKA